MTTQVPRIEAILVQAVEISDAEARGAFVRQACGEDAALRAAVEQLINNHFRAGEFLEVPACAPWRELPGDSELKLPGTMIGPYRLLEIIGQGGMGSVYAAEQEVPVRRRVALKIVTPGLDTREVMARFEAERQTLALMDHPHIARVLDAGTTDQGRPYFVMELVRGIPITDYCNQADASITERLSLFVAVCHAIQHAHQKGIIHRDIKPSNVLVTVCDGVPIPKVIDFGVAKAIDPRLGDLAVQTRHAQMIGTPLYMSPEQSDLRAVDVDTRSDVYSLGTLLYELLTGATPFDKGLFATGDLEQWRRIMRDVEPPRPSARVLTMRLATATTARPGGRGEPRKRVQELRGELDWIVMKALEKPRERRYQTARGLATDIERYLRGEPVEACPPSALYRLRKFVRRHRLIMVTVALVASSLLAGTAVSIWQAREANAARRLADRRLEQEMAARRDVLARETDLRRELYATELHQAWLHWCEGDLARCAALLEQQQPVADQTDLRGFEWFYLWDMVHRQPIVLGGHAAPILTADVSPDDRYVASGDREGWVRIWDLANGRELEAWRSSTQEVCSVRFSPDGRTLATAGQDATIHLWHAESWTEAARLEQGHDGTICALAWSPDGQQLASAARDQTVRIWDPVHAHATHALTEHTDVVRALAWAGDGHLLASAGGDLLVRLWDPASGALVGTLAGAEHGLLALAISADNRWLAAGGYNGPVIVFDLVGRQEWTRITPAGTAWSLRFSPNRPCLAIGRGDGRLDLWEVTDQPAGAVPVRTAHQSHSSLRDVRFTHDGRHLAIAAEEDAVIYVQPVDQLAGRIVRTCNGSCLSADVDHDVAVSADSDHALLLLQNRLGPEPVYRIETHAAPVVDAVLAPGGNLLASSDQSGAVWLHSTRSGHPVRPLQATDVPVQHLTFSPDGTYLAGSGPQGSVDLWQAATGRRLHTFSPQAAAQPVFLAFAPDSQTLAASLNGTVSLWDVRTGRCVTSLPHLGRWSFGMAFDPGGRTLAIGASGDIFLWDATTGVVDSLALDRRIGVEQVAVSPDGRTLAALTNDRQVELWHLPTHRKMFTVLEAARPLTQLAFPTPHTLLVGTAPDVRQTTDIFLWHGPR